MFVTGYTVCKQWRIAWYKRQERTSKIEWDMLKMRFLHIAKQSILLVIVVMVLRGCMRKVVDVTKQQQAVFLITGDDYHEYDLILKQKIEEDTVVVTYAITWGVGISDKQNRFITLEKSGFDNDDTYIVKQSIFIV